MVSAALRKPAKIRTDDNPVEVKIADVDVSLPIKAMGATKKGEMELPETVAEVGWYRFGANPSWKPVPRSWPPTWTRGPRGWVPSRGSAR